MREPRPGPFGAASLPEGSSSSNVAGTVTDFGAGDAGIVLSLFFPSVEGIGPVVPLVEEVVGRVVRGVAEMELRVVPVREDLGFEGLVVVA